MLKIPFKIVRRMHDRALPTVRPVKKTYNFIGKDCPNVPSYDLGVLPKKMKKNNLKSKLEKMFKIFKL